jgi:hypothetical protein
MRLQPSILNWLCGGAMAFCVLFSGPTASINAAQDASSPLPRTAYLFSFFRDNGQDGLFLAWSADGRKWKEITPPGKSFLQPRLGDKLMRDPCIRKGPDGTYHMVWTTGWHDKGFGHASSKDLIHWSDQQMILVMEHEAGAKNTWAPELFYDDVRKEYLIFWATTIPGRFPATEEAGDGGLNHRIYYTATKDFRTFTPTALFFDGGFNVIDATLVKTSRKQYYLVVKDETLKPVKKNLRIARAENARGPFSPAGDPFTGSWVEGPSVLRVGHEYVVYYDHYNKPQHYGAMASPDLKTFRDITPELSFPDGVRHGTMIAVPGSFLRKVLAARGLQ